jgi:hypothetical protein
LTEKKIRVERASLGIEQSWFGIDPKLSKKKGLAFVFLEGPSGSGKNDILNR